MNDRSNREKNPTERRVIETRIISACYCWIHRELAILLNKHRVIEYVEEEASVDEN
jgi:hypothetical protein